MGAGENSAFIAEGRYWVNNHAHVLRPNRHVILDEWLVYCLNYSDLMPFVTGLTVPKLNQAQLRSIPVLVPPVAEQKRIVAILDEAFEGVRIATANAKKNLANARELFEIVYDQMYASSGESWTTKNLSELAEFKNGLNFTRSSRGERIKIVGVKDFQSNLVVPAAGLVEVHIDGTLSDEYLLRSGDILTVRSNGNRELIGRCMIARDVPKRCSHSGFTIRIRPTTGEVDPHFLVRFLKTPTIRAMLVASGDGTNISSLNQTALAQLPVAYPDIDAQREIIEQSAELEAETAILARAYKGRLELLDRLKQSVLTRAFAGELTAAKGLAA